MGWPAFADLTVVCRNCHEFGFREYDGCPIANFQLHGINVISANNMDSRQVFVHGIENSL
jgi:hypothetical protein